MRSRFAAFALGLGDYLVDTLTAVHEDRNVPRADLVRVLSDAKNKQRFLGLSVVHATALGDRGEVLFVARIFERGADRSFGELSTFVREEGAWRYEDGVVVSRSKLPEDLTSLSREAFVACAAK